MPQSHIQQLTLFSPHNIPSEAILYSKQAVIMELAILVQLSLDGLVKPYSINCHILDEAPSQVGIHLTFDVASMARWKATIIIATLAPVNQPFLSTKLLAVLSVPFS